MAWAYVTSLCNIIKSRQIGFYFGLSRSQTLGLPPAQRGSSCLAQSPLSLTGIAPPKVSTESTQGALGDHHGAVASSQEWCGCGG